MKKACFLFFILCFKIVVSQVKDSAFYYYNNLCSYNNAIRCYEKKIKNVKSQHHVDKAVDHYNLAVCYALTDKKYLKKIIKNLEISIKADSIIRYAIIGDADFYKLIEVHEWRDFILQIRPKSIVEKINSDTSFYINIYKMIVRDQALYKALNCIQSKFGTNSFRIKRIWKEKDSLNQLNMSMIEKFRLDNINILSNKEVGSFFAGRVFLIIQHSDTSIMNKYLPIIKSLYLNGEQSGESYALLYDRVSLNKNKGKQFYGTQIDTETNTLYPIIDEKNVNKRRKEFGMDPLENYLRKFNIIYIPKKH